MFITIFTPTYNRAYTLSRLYDSIKGQTGCKFEWVIVDDGSSDGTDELVRSWMDGDAPAFPIRLFRQENSGKHVAWNKGLSEARGDVFFPVDSDDYLVFGAIASIVKMVSTVGKDDANIIAVSGVREFPGNALTGGLLQTTDKPYIDYSSIDRRSKGITGDLAEAFFTEKLRKYPFPTFAGEKFVPEAVVFNRFSNDGMLIRGFAQPLYHCEYLSDGYTKNTNRLLTVNWRGYSLYVEELMASKVGVRAKAVPFCGYVYRYLLKALHVY